MCDDDLVISKKERNDVELLADRPQRAGDIAQRYDSRQHTQEGIAATERSAIGHDDLAIDIAHERCRPVALPVDGGLR